MKKSWSFSIVILILAITATTGMAKTDIMNVLVLGQYQGRFETVMVNMYQSGTMENRILSIPPGAIFVDGGSLLQADKIVNLLAESGIRPVQTAVSAYLRIPIPYYLIVDYDGAQSVVDAMGGVYFDLPYELELPGESDQPALLLKACPQVFDGDTARRFLRYRTGDLHGPAELQIIELQQRFLDAMIRQLAEEKRKILPVALKLPKMIKTNIGVFNLLNLAYDALKMDPEKLKVEYGILPGTFKQVEGQYQYQIKGMEGYSLPKQTD